MSLIGQCKRCGSREDLIEGIICTRCQARALAPRPSTTTRRPRSTRSLYAETHADEARSDGRCPSCGTYCYGDCRS